MTSESHIYLESNALEIKVRETIINIMQQEKFLLEDKLIISFQMLSTILENDDLGEDALLKELESIRIGIM